MENDWILWLYHTYRLMNRKWFILNYSYPTLLRTHSMLYHSRHRYINVCTGSLRWECLRANSNWYVIPLANNGMVMSMMRMLMYRWSSQLVLISLMYYLMRQVGLNLLWSVMLHSGCMLDRWTCLHMLMLLWIRRRRGALPVLLDRCWARRCRSANIVLFGRRCIWPSTFKWINLIILCN